MPFQNLLLLRLLVLAESRGELFIMGVIIIGPHSQIYNATKIVNAFKGRQTKA